MRRGFIAVLVAFLALGCNDKSGVASDAGLFAARLDGGDGGAHASADGGSDLEDTALPQTSGEELSARMRHLLEAISQENADLAADVLFPRDAYAATKDLSDASKAWE